MVGKKSGKALLREEGMLPFLNVPLLKLCIAAEAPLQDALLLTSSTRPGKDGQQPGSHNMASGDHDQSEKLLYVSLLDWPCATLQYFSINRHSRNVSLLQRCTLCAWNLSWTDNM